LHPIDPFWSLPEELIVPLFIGSDLVKNVFVEPHLYFSLSVSVFTIFFNYESLPSNEVKATLLGASIERLFNVSFEGPLLLMEVILFGI